MRSSVSELILLTSPLQRYNYWGYEVGSQFCSAEGLMVVEQVGACTMSGHLGSERKRVREAKRSEAGRPTINTDSFRSCQGRTSAW